MNRRRVSVAPASVQTHRYSSRSAGTTAEALDKCIALSELETYPLFQWLRASLRSALATGYLLFAPAPLKQTTPGYSVRAAALKHTTPGCSVHAAALKQTTPGYSVRAAALKQTTPGYSVRAAALKQTTPGYSVRAAA